MIQLLYLSVAFLTLQVHTIFLIHKTWTLDKDKLAEEYNYEDDELTYHKVLH